MRIQVTRTGGLAGIKRQAAVDTAVMPDAPDWHALADDALKEGPGGPPLGVPDGFHYEITVDGESIHTAEPRLSEAQRQLVARVLKEGE
ncbi:protealysin inhibitor emfourin [Streptomyces tsukubensis]|uniref:Metalloprotease n=1 Tax=Streptomyces tsukubensis TaxID=83656 RepID=A0A1V4ABW1_9ACTN|nr:protealysin inhibitor emfourin [Streptomyces tsukubensis]OON80861.1 hypothetical protein B1H18_10780 [Streptomyces tsukubensis]QFR93497.1 hypothetical protein GBW32_10885 [Streptomyces tsukubensis]